MEATSLANDFAGVRTKVVWFGDLHPKCCAILRLGTSLVSVDTNNVSIMAWVVGDSRE